MRFAELMTYWEMKDMLSARKRLTEVNCQDTNAMHCVCSCVVTKNFEHATVLYKHDIINGSACNFALIYSDIIFTGTEYEFIDNTKDQLFIKNANVGKLIDYFVGDML